jgi:hypothetical protein
MLEFKPFGFAVNAQVTKLSKGEFYSTDVDKEELWKLYLESIPTEYNPIYKERTEHDCNCCKNFIRNIGGLVSIVNGKIETVWNVDNIPAPYKIVADILNDYVLKHKIVSIYRTTEGSYGKEVTKSLIGAQIVNFNHFYYNIDKKFLSNDPVPVIAQFRESKELLLRSLEICTVDALVSVTDLISSNSIYRGEEFSNSVHGFLSLKTAYSKLKTNEERELFLIEQATKNGQGLCRFKNTVIGTLVEDLSKDVDLEEAVGKYESKVAPQNYKRSSSLVTPKMVEEALSTVKSLNLEGTLGRRLANPEDININDVIWANKAIRVKLKSDVEELFEGLLEKKKRATRVKKELETEVDDIHAAFEIKQKARKSNKKKDVVADSGSGN